MLLSYWVIKSSGKVNEPSKVFNTRAYMPSIIQNALQSSITFSQATIMIFSGPKETWLSSGATPTRWRHHFFRVFLFFTVSIQFFLLFWFQHSSFLTSPEKWYSKTSSYNYLSSCLEFLKVLCTFCAFITQLLSFRHYQKSRCIHYPF